MRRLSLMVALLVTLSTSAQGAPTTWEALTSAEFDAYRYVFAPYGIEAHRNDLAILKMRRVVIFRIEGSDFCVGTLCQTIVLLDCSQATCPSTSLFAKRQVEFDRTLTRHLGGTEFLAFRLSAERDIVVMFNNRFVSVWRGFGEN